MRLHPKVPLFGFLGLVQLRVSLTFVVLGGVGRSNQGGVDGGQQLSAQIVRFVQVAKARNRAFIRLATDACIELRKHAVKLYAMQGFLHGGIRQTKPLLHAVNTQQGENSKQWAAGLARMVHAAQSTKPARPTAPPSSSRREIPACACWQARIRS